MLLIKKYSNRRLYDTKQSRYITIEELTETVRRGAEVRVVDAKTDEDLTQVTLTQIILEGRGAAKLLPTRLLTQLIRLEDDLLGDFLGSYLSTSLDLYLQARSGMQSISPWNPFAAMMNFAPGTFIGRNANGTQAPPRVASNTDVIELRRELDELKLSMKEQVSAPPAPKRRKR